MRIRTVKPEFWTHPVMARLQPDVQLLALALLNYADDHGYFRAEPELVRAACCPFTEDSVRIHGGLTTLLKVGWIEVRDSGQTGVIGRIAKWEKHQRVNRPSPSKLKAYWFSEDSVNAHGMLSEASLPEQGTGNRERNTPIVPLQGTRDEGGELKPEGEQEQSDNPLALEVEAVEPVREIHPCLQRVRRMHRRRETTPLDAATIRAWRRAHAAVTATTADEWAVLEGYYSAEIEKRHDYRRRDEVTHLNNWSGELTRAAAWAKHVGFVRSEISEKKEKGPVGWKEILAELYPDGDLSVYPEWHGLPEDLKEAVLAVLAAAGDPPSQPAVDFGVTRGRAKDAEDAKEDAA